MQRYPVPRLALQIEREWALEIGQLLSVSSEQIIADGLSWPFDRVGKVKIELMDGSIVEMNDSFHLVSESKKAIVLFTEHCGHFLFPYHDAKVFVDGQLIYQQS
jgi:hypothetical protein